MDIKNIGKSFAKLIDFTFVNIDGILVQRGINPVNGDEGYIWDGRWCPTIDDVRIAKDFSANAIKMSIVNPNGEEITLPRNYINKYKQGLSPYVEYKRDQIKKSE